MSKKARQPRQQQPASRRTARAPSFWQGPLPIIGSVAVVVIVIVVFIVISRRGPTPPTPTDPAVISKLTSVSTAVTDQVGTGGQANPFTRTSTVTVLTGPNGKPEVLYIGAEWCPYCAAERWAMVVALSHFGSFQGLTFTTSSSSDAFPDTRTLSFSRITWGSAYLDFVAVEVQDRNGKTLQTPTQEEQQTSHKYDPEGSIPFLDVANLYTAIGRGVPPDVLQGLSWQQIADALSNPNSPVTKAIVGNANYLTAGICKLSGPDKAPICSDATIQQIAAQLPAA